MVHDSPATARHAGHVGGKLSGEVEVDETFIGGKARNMHSRSAEQKITGRGPEGKAIVAAVLERRGEVRATVVEDRRKRRFSRWYVSMSKPDRTSTPMR